MTDPCDLARAFPDPPAPTWHPGDPPPLRLLEPAEVLRALDELRGLEELHRMASRAYYARDGRDA